MASHGSSAIAFADQTNDGRTDKVYVHSGTEPVNYLLWRSLYGVDALSVAITWRVLRVTDLPEAEAQSRDGLC